MTIVVCVQEMRKAPRWTSSVFERQNRSHISLLIRSHAALGKSNKAVFSSNSPVPRARLVPGADVVLPQVLRTRSCMRAC